jgi:hypothetical protein
MPFRRMHPLLPHHLRHLVSLHASEVRFLCLLEELQHFIPRLRCCLGGVETDSRQRIDTLRLLATANGADAPARAIARHPGACIGEVTGWRSTSERLAQALRICSLRHRALMNDYRIAREVAHRLGFRLQAERLDHLLGRMADTFPIDGSRDGTMEPVIASAPAG